MIRKTSLLLLSATFLFSFATPSVAFAADAAKNDACEAISTLNPSGGNCSNPGGTTVNRVIRIALNALSFIAGIIAVFMIIISGLKYVTSQGDPTQASSSKRTLIFAIVGLIVVLMAQAIVRFVLTETT